MVYSKESAKWKAYQFSDPFATNSFLICNKATQIFCRPDCDQRPKTNLKNEIKYVEYSDEALKLGFVPCKLCDPMNKPLIDVELLTKCVTTINEKIGFMKPLTDENEDLNNDKIKENILVSKKTNEENILNVIDSNLASRRQSMPNIKSIDISSSNVDSINLSKNDSDHYRLVDLACRHLAYAAAINLFFPQKYLEDDSNISIGKDGKKKRRRGGVLGFKELAAKSKLSAWHFHRVFKSVTGLTPKTYGDKCNEFLENYKDSKFINYSRFNQSITPVSNHESPIEYDSPPSKKQKRSSPIQPQMQMPQIQMVLPPTNQMKNIPNYTPPTEYNLPDFNIAFNEFDRSSSVPDLTKYDFSLLQPTDLPFEQFYEHPVELNQANLQNVPMGQKVQIPSSVPSYTQSPSQVSLSSVQTQSPFEAPSLFSHCKQDDDYNRNFVNLNSMSNYNSSFNFGYDDDVLKPIDNFDLPVEDFNDFNDINDFITTGIE